MNSTLSPSRTIASLHRKGYSRCTFTNSPCTGTDYVCGLTTAASIWITAAIGILAGIGFYFPMAIAAILTIGTLSVFRWIEAKMPSQLHAHHSVRFTLEAPMPEADYRQLIAAHGFTIANLSYRANKTNNYFEYQMMIRTRDHNNAQRLTETLSKLEAVSEYRISPTGD